RHPSGRVARIRPAWASTHGSPETVSDNHRRRRRRRRRTGGGGMTQAEQVLAKTEQRTTELARAGDEMSVEQLVERVRKVHEVQRLVMKEGVHYGNFPGVDKPALFKPGAEVLGLAFRLDPQFDITEHVRERNHP